MPSKAAIKRHNKYWPSKAAIKRHNKYWPSKAAIKRHNKYWPSKAAIKRHKKAHKKQKIKIERESDVGESEDVSEEITNLSQNESAAAEFMLVFHNIQFL